MRQARLPDFDGRTFRRNLEHERLASNLLRVYELMQDGEWHTTPEIRAVGGSAGDARMRDLRKQNFGGHEITRRRVQGKPAVWEFRMIRPGDSS